MSSSIIEVIQHYQRSIDKSQDDEGRLLHCIQKLYKLPIKVEHLQETGIGKTVNSLRKFSGEIGVAAKALVTKWKAMVAAEDEPLPPPAASTENTDDDEDRKQPSDDDCHNGEEDQNSNNSAHDKRAYSSSKEKKDKHKSRERLSESHHNLSTNSHVYNSHSANEDKHKSSSSSADRKHKDRHSKRQHDENMQKTAEPEEKRSKNNEKHHDKDKRKSSSSGSSSSIRHKSNSSSSAVGCSKTKEDETKAVNNSTKHSTEEQRKSENKHSHRDKDKDRSKDKDKSSKSESHHSKSSASKSCSSSSSKEKEKEQREKHKSSHSTSNSRNSSVVPAADTNSSEIKRRRTSDEMTQEAPKSKVSKIAIAEANSNDSGNENDGGIDSTMGANFADVLGMLNYPSKKSKKMVNLSKNASVTASSSNQQNVLTKSSNSSRDNNSPRSLSQKPNSKTENSSSNKPSTSSSSNKNSSNLKPDLLLSSAKLAPLDPSIALELPSISTNYKPMPLNQTVMDCVFNSASSSASRPMRTITDAEAISHGISSKTMRTKIYSGSKSGQIHQVVSLFDLCIRVLQKNIDALEYTGGVPFEVLRPVLERATPQQLLIFEDYNPYLMEDSDILWQHHVQRNYRTQKRMEMESWREMFMRCQEDQERKLNILTDNIKQSQKIIAAPVRKTQLAFVDSMVKPPRNVQRKQEQYGTKSKLIATPAARVAALCQVTPNAAKTGDTRLRVAAATRDHAQVAASAVRPKKAPLMAKTLQFMKGRLKR